MDKDIKKYTDYYPFMFFTSHYDFTKLLGRSCIFLALGNLSFVAKLLKVKIWSPELYKESVFYALVGLTIFLLFLALLCLKEYKRILDKDEKDTEIINMVNVAKHVKLKKDEKIEIINGYKEGLSGIYRKYYSGELIIMELYDDEGIINCPYRAYADNRLKRRIINERYIFMGICGAVVLYIFKIMMI